MSFLISQIKEHLIGLGHTGTLNKVRNIEALFERAASQFILQVKPLELMRLAALSQTIHDDVYNYALPSDYFDLIDLIPQDNREQWDSAFRTPAGKFDLGKAIQNRTVSIEGSEGSKIIRINWRTRTGTVLHTMDSVTSNGTWSAVASATGVEANTIFKKTGNASIEFNIVVTGDGIQNTTMNSVDLTDADEVGDFFVWMYFGTAPTSVSARWGNDLTTNYWTPVSQTTQADGTAFKVGWNLIKFPWSTATETGTVAPATIDAFRVTVASSAQNNVRVDNIVCSIGRNFDIKYYTKYLYKNSAGTYISRPTSDDDTVIVDNDSLPIYLYSLLEEMAQQVEGTDSAFDINFATSKLQRLFPHFRGMYPNQAKKTLNSYSSTKGRLSRMFRR